MANDIIERIENILNSNEDVPQKTTNKLILLGMAEVLKSVQDHGARLADLERYRPYLQGLAWAVAVIAGAVLFMALTGRLAVTVLP